MAGGIVPYDPIFDPKAIADGIWIVDGSIIRFGMGPFQAPFTTRMTIVRLPGGKLWLHSPIEPDSGLRGRIGGLGTVGHLIAPNPIHYWWVPDWHALYPHAQVHAVEQLRTRAKRPIPEFRALGEEPLLEWAGHIDQLLVEDGWFGEAVFFHRASRTLVLADLIENFEPSRVKSWAYRLLLRLGGVSDPDGSMPRDMRLSFRRHRPQLKRAVEQMIAWDPERIVLSHGRWYDRNGAQELRRAFRWLL